MNQSKGSLNDTKGSEIVLNQSERALKTLLYAMLLGIVGVLIYAVEAITWVGFFKSVGVGIIVASASMFVVGLVLSDCRISFLLPLDPPLPSRRICATGHRSETSIFEEKD